MEISLDKSGAGCNVRAARYEIMDVFRAIGTDPRQATQPAPNIHHLHTIASEGKSHRCVGLSQWNIGDTPEMGTVS